MTVAIFSERFHRAMENFFSTLIDSEFVEDDVFRMVLENGVVGDVFLERITSSIDMVQYAIFYDASGDEFFRVFDVNVFLSDFIGEIFPFRFADELFLVESGDIISEDLLMNFYGYDFSFFDGKRIEFGSEIDIVYLSGERADYMEDQLEDGSVEISSAAFRVSLVEIESLQLSDGSYMYDVPGESLDYIYRLYDAAFARTPDLGGLTFWNNEVRAGRISGEDLANFFVDSSEFAEKFGEDPTDEDFVNALYGNVLRREADPEGLGFWTGVFASGEKTRADMLEFFAESPENVARNADNLDDGVWVV